MHARFEPSGFTKSPDIPMAKSLVDYIFRWLHLTFVESKPQVLAPVSMESATETVTAASVNAEAPAEEADGRVDKQFEHFMDDAPACDVCGSITVRNGGCYKCFNCGNSMSCS